MTRLTSPHTRRSLVLAALALVLCVASADRAGAATYAVDGCQRPDGTVVGTQGWIPSSSGEFVSDFNRCPEGSGLGVAFDPTTPIGTGAFASWTFAAPSGTTLDRFSADRTARSSGSQPQAVPETFIRTNAASLERCSTVTACSTLDGSADYSLAGSSSVTFGVACSGAGGGFCPAGTTSLSLKAIRIQLSDDASPFFDADPTGTLTSSTTTERVRSVAYTASDTGGGLYRQRLLADGVEVASASVDDNGGKCVRYAVGNGFASPVPCKLSAASGMSLDTASLADGEHVLALQVLDATNENKASASWPIVVDNVAPVIGGVEVGGAAVEGQVLRCSATAAGQGTRLAYQWLRAEPAGTGAVEIPGATSSSYLVASQDVGRRLLCRVTATDGGGTSTSTSAFNSGSPASAVVAPKDSATAGADAKSAGRTAGTIAPSLAALPVCTIAKVTLGSAVRSFTRSHRRSGMTIVGRLTATSDGRGLGGAALEVMQTVTRAGASRRTKIASTRTAPTGTFSVQVPAGPTRVLELRDPACGALGPKMAQRVRGAISARTTTPRVRNGQTARIRGRVLGGHVGRGLPLELQVKVGSTWRDVKAVTTNARGDFRVGYRFTRTFVRYTYRFRVISRGGTAWPYLRASSAQIRIRVN